VDDSEQQDRLAQRIVAEGLSVRALEEIIALGEQDGKSAKRSGDKSTSPQRDAEVEEVAGRLSDLLDTRVRVNMGRRKGKIVVEFATRDDLARIVAAIGERQG
jgi:ParB family transcriptional regulator, chromosome partitioning protein